MARKKKSEYYQKNLEEHLRQRAHAPLIIAVTVIYFLTLGGLIYLTMHFSIPLYKEDYGATSWLRVIQAYYYAVPFVFAVFFGLLFRPFLRHFRNLLITIFVIQGIYSLVVFGFRYEHLQKYNENIHLSEIANIYVKKIQHRMNDKNNDGLIDDIAFRLQLVTPDYPNGEYIAYATITQKGQPLPENEIGHLAFEIEQKEDRNFKVDFHFDPTVYQHYYDRGDFEFNLAVERLISVNEEGNKILQFSRWAPFARQTAWDGWDSQIREAIVELQHLQKLDYIHLLPLDITRKEIDFLQYIDDFGRDTDGDGLFDELVVQLEVHSLHEGQAYLQAQILGSEFPLYNTIQLQSGLNLIEYSVGAADLHEFGLDGPYDFINFHIFKENPECIDKECHKRLKRAFQIYFDNYYSKDYALIQFDAE